MVIIRVMRRFFVTLTSIVVFSVGLAHAGPSFESDRGKVLLFVGQDVDSIDAYLKAVPRQRPAGFMTYTSLANLDGLDQPHDEGGGIQHAQSLVERYPNSAL